MKIESDVVAAIKFIHEQDIVHRDIKLPNVLVPNQHYCHLQGKEETEKAWSQLRINCL